MLYRVIYVIITVNEGTTLYSVSKQYSVPVSKLMADNGILGDELVVGQSLVVDVPEESIVTTENTTAEMVSRQYNIEKRELFRNNYILSGRNEIKDKTFVVLSYLNKPNVRKIIGGYAYDFISADRLSEVVNYLTFVMPFTYGFTPEGALVAANDTYILDVAENAGTKALLHISTLTDEGLFDSNLPSFVFENSSVREKLINNIVGTVLEKGYDGVDIDFEYLTETQKEGYNEFTLLLAQELHRNDKILVVAVPPKTSADQKGSLVEGIDYAALGNNADYVMIMAYEYGYKYGPAMAIAPENMVRRVLDYAISEIPNEKILLGISNYGYDWTLPYVRGESDAPSISTTRALEIAKMYGAEIMFDEISKAPYFFYTDEIGLVHEVWYEDARSFEAKLSLIKEYNLAGGFIWDLMRENPQGFVTINSMLEII